MKIIKTADYEEMSRKAANIISAQLILYPRSVLGLATGSSPKGTYQHLIENFKNGDIDFSQIKTINLDEYKGIEPDHPQSYTYYMYENLFHHVNIDFKNINIPNGMEEDIEKECNRYDQVISSLGGIDLQVLGIGINGHIGFNEPDICFKKSTHCASLSESTITTNSRFFQNKDDIPRYAYTIGIGNIMAANKIILLVNGLGKAKILKEIVEGPITPSVPASILQLHKDVTIIADQEAVSLLS